MSCSVGAEADAAQTFQVEVLDVGRRRLHDHLQLVVVLQAVGVLAVAAVLGAARGLHVGGIPGPRAERAQRRRRVEGAGAHLHVVRLQHDAALLGPERLQRQDEVLERLVGPQTGGVWRRRRRAGLAAALVGIVGPIGAQRASAQAAHYTHSRQVSRLPASAAAIQARMQAGVPQDRVAAGRSGGARLSPANQLADRAQARCEAKYSYTDGRVTAMCRQHSGQKLGIR